MNAVRSENRATTIAWQEALQRTFDWPSIKRSVLSAALVGTVVNAINQGSEILADHRPVIWKIAFTYVVPFLVVSYGRFSALRR